MDTRLAGNRPSSDLPLPARVVRVERETPDTMTLAVERPAGLPCSFRPGQFNMIYAFGVGEVPISICGDPSDGECLVHTVRAVGPATTAIDRMKPGDVLGIRGPFGVPWPLDTLDGSDLVLAAGGLGLAAIRSALYAILANRKRFGNVALLYGARTPGDLLYAVELNAWRARGDLQVEVIVDHATSDWTGSVGVVTALVPRARCDPARTAVLLCGPEVMMRFMAREFLARGIAPQRLFLSMERNMRCGTGLCGHCQFGPMLVCRDGPVLSWERLERWLSIQEL